LEHKKLQPSQKVLTKSSQDSFEEPLIDLTIATKPRIIEKYKPKILMDLPDVLTDYDTVCPEMSRVNCQVSDDFQKFQDRTSTFKTSKKETDACINATPRELNWSPNHFSRLRYSLRAASEASSRQKGGGVASSTDVSSFSSWQMSKERATVVGSLA